MVLLWLDFYIIPLLLNAADVVKLYIVMKFIFYSLGCFIFLTPLSIFGEDNSSPKEHIKAATQSLKAQLANQPNNLPLRESVAKHLYDAGAHQDVVNTLNPYTNVIGVPSFLILAGSYKELGDFLNQVRVLDLLQNKDSENHLNHFILADARLLLAESLKDEMAKKKEEDRAIHNLRQAISLNPGYKPAYDKLLTIFIKNQNNYESRTLITTMIGRFKDRPEFYIDLCRLYSTDGFLNQAVESCTKAIELAPNFPDSYAYLAQSLKDQDKNDEAARQLTQAAQRFPKSEFVQRAAGQFYMLRENHPVAARYFRQATNADPSSVTSQLGLAQSLFSSEQFTPSLKAFSVACRLDPQATLPIFQAAAAHLRQKDRSSEISREFSRQVRLCQ